jgi:hypothetical protein
LQLQESLHLLNLNQLGGRGGPDESPSSWCHGRRGAAWSPRGAPVRPQPVCRVPVQQSVHQLPPGQAHPRAIHSMPSSHHP